MSLKACVLDYQSLCPDDLGLDALFALPLDGKPVEWALHDATQPEDTAERLEGVSVVLSNKVVIDATLMQANPQLKLIIILATGTNNVDLEAAKAQGIQVSNIVAYSTEAVVQQTFALMLSLSAQLVPFTKAVNDGRWSQSQFFGLLDYQINEVAGKTLGIIGYGAIGRRVKTVAEAFGMKVLVAKSLAPGANNNASGNNTDSERVDLHTLYCSSDIISVHSPLTPESHNLIDREALAMMQPHCLLLNLGRGGIVNEEALLDALVQKRIAGAALDVLAQEPPAVDHPLVNAQLDNLLITPHTAWASQQARQRLVDQVVNIMQSFNRGEVVNPV